MLLPLRLPLFNQICTFGCTALLAATMAHAQSADTNSTSDSAAWSSSQAGSLEVAAAAAPASASLPSAPSASSSAAAQSDTNTYSGWRGRDIKNRLTWEAGGGFNAPAGDSASITWGGQFQVGGGVNINRYLAMLVEYQFLDDKLTRRADCRNGRNRRLRPHLVSYPRASARPVPKSSNDIYVTGGGGFYRKVTSFTDPQEVDYCDYYYGYCGITTENAVVGHFSSNQGGFNVGVGFQHRIGGLYGDSHTKIFAEARYLDVLSPAVVGITPSGLGVTTVGADTKVIPVSVGVRF